ncbi:hypothetical protein DV096_18570 [Bradymonadaceae bacterium TMQ3]|uniref:DUF4382 domain-containing protein n=1 Tax=Lujinxingia sediminis TaxID=2480984 RepID=A0ABY0CP35_9DELT|nr:hypothetical protein [Lujinxingia sediminis]RDV36459.1 hypothetical protein DV096_18570 [Bradymonadaceae bacterium TMQ3]RVU41429.1 hypothetical protein EA187_18980 [Lujinxingia sediminis]TXC74512.1 hypothetical protein FRC91_15470 [Bradymonadales bacterium TMQ1]
MKRSRSLPTCVLAAALLLSACGESRPPVQVQLPVIVDASGLANTSTDLGYTIALTETQVAMRDLVFLTGEVEHTSLPRRAYDLLVPSALAHPGHSEGGEVTGELAGSFEVDWSVEGARELGQATLLVGDYTSASLTLGRLSSAPETSIRLAGTATRAGEAVDFSFEVAAPEGRAITAIRFEDTLLESPGEGAHLRFRMVLDEVFGEGHLFDGVDFEELATEGILSFGPTDGDPIYLEVRRRLLSHDHIEFQLQE